LTYLVKDVMTKEAVAVNSEDTIEEASKVMAEKRRAALEPSQRDFPEAPKASMAI